MPITPRSKDTRIGLYEIDNENKLAKTEGRSPRGAVELLGENAYLLFLASDVNFHNREMLKKLKDPTSGITLAQVEFDFNGFLDLKQP